MLEVLTDLVRTVVLLVLLAVLVEMLLPSGELARFVRLVMGLFVLAAVLGAVGRFLPHLGEAVPSLAPAGNGAVAVDERIRSLEAYQREAVWSLLEHQLKRQVEAALTSLGLEVREVKIRADSEWRWGQGPTWDGLEVYLSRAGAKRHSEPGELARYQEEVRQQLAQVLGLSPEQIEVNWTE
ncbi:MAG: stage III sporulation protein AF [Moorellales bacterium]